MSKKITAAIFVVGIVVGLVVFLLLGSLKPYGTPKLGFNTILYFPTSKNQKKCLHIHHWIWCLITIALIILGVIMIIYGTHHSVKGIFKNKLNLFFYSVTFLIGFLVGAALDDLRYPDWNIFRIYCPKDKTILQELQLNQESK